MTKLARAALAGFCSLLTMAEVAAAGQDPPRPLDTQRAVSGEGCGDCRRFLPSIGQTIRIPCSPVAVSTPPARPRSARSAARATAPAPVEETSEPAEVDCKVFVPRIARTIAVPCHAGSAPAAPPRSGLDAAAHGGGRR
jgi:hypothetical protein